MGELQDGRAPQEAVADVGLKDGSGVDERRRAADSAGRGRAEADAGGGEGDEPLVQVRDLVKHFPITRGVFLQKQVGAVQAVDGVELRRAPRRDARDRRRDGLRARARPRG